MGVVRNCLNSHVNHPTFVNECTSFFTSHKNVFEKILIKGKFVQEIAKDVASELDQVLDDGDRGLKLVLDTGIPISKYKQVAELNKVKNTKTGEWEQFSYAGVRFPNFFPSYEKVQEKYNEYKKQVHIEEVKDCGGHAAQWPLVEWLESMLTSPFYSKFLKPKRSKEGLRKFEIIIRGDGLKANGTKSCFLLATLGNFDVLSKCVLFNSVVNFAQVDEKDTDNVRKAFK